MRGDVPDLSVFSGFPPGNQRLCRFWKGLIFFLKLRFCAFPGLLHVCTPTVNKHRLDSEAGQERGRLGLVYSNYRCVWVGSSRLCEARMEPTGLKR